MPTETWIPSTNAMLHPPVGLGGTIHPGSGVVVARTQKFRFSSGREHDLIPLSLRELLSRELQGTMSDAMKTAGGRIVLEVRDERPVQVLSMGDRSQD